MKFEYIEREPKEFYEEALYIMFKYRELLKKPKLKVKSIVKDFNFYKILGIVALIFQLLSYLMFGNIIFLVFTGMVIFVIIFLFLLSTNSNRQIEVLSNKKGTIKVEFNKKSIIYDDVNKKYEMSWDEIAFATINKYTISFIPKNFTGVLIVIPIRENEKLFKYLSKNNVKIDVYDNSNKYK